MAVGHNSNAAFYSISNGKICRQFTAPTETSKERTNKNGRIVHEDFYDFIDGRIIGIDTKDSEYGRFWMITLQDKDGNYVLQMPYSSGYSGAFLKTLPNINLSSSVKLIPKLTIEGDKKKTTLFVNQHGKALKHYYNRESPNGLPELEQKKIKGKMVYDDSLIMEFLEKMVVEDIQPKLKDSKKVGVVIHDQVEVDNDAQTEDAPF